jgi:signal peptidase I
MLYYPIDPNKSFVKRVIAEEGDNVRIVDGRVFVNEAQNTDDFVLEDTARTTTGTAGDTRGLLLRDGRPPEQQPDSRHWGFVPKR